MSLIDIFSSHKNVPTGIKISDKNYHFWCKFTFWVKIPISAKTVYFSGKFTVLIELTSFLEVHNPGGNLFQNSRG